MGAVVRGIGDTVLNLLLIVLRPILIGIITLIEDLTSPFVRMASGIPSYPRHPRYPRGERGWRCAPCQEKCAPAASKILHRLSERHHLHTPGSCRGGACGPWCAAAQGLRFVLNVRVNGENVGYVESEQVFENAVRTCSPVSTRPSVCCRPPALRWRTQAGIMPDLLKAFHRQSDDDRARSPTAILRTCSDEIINSTAVCVDDQLLCTARGDHLRSYLGKHQGTV